MAHVLARKRLAAPERREQVHAVAMGLFARRGFSGTTTREIAEAAGVSEALLFRLFPDKESLYAAIIQHKIDASCEDHLPEDAARRGDDREVLRHLGLGLLERMKSDPSFTRLLLHSGMEGHALADMFYRLRMRSTLKFLEDYLRRRVNARALRRVDPALVARTFFGTICNHALMRELFEAERKSRISDEAFVDSIVDIMLNGMVPSGPRRRPR